MNAYRYRGMSLVGYARVGYWRGLWSHRNVDIYTGPPFIVNADDQQLSRHPFVVIHAESGRVIVEGVGVSRKAALQAAHHAARIAHITGRRFRESSWFEERGECR